jgi:hypothetical protein
MHACMLMLLFFNTCVIVVSRNGVVFGANQLQDHLTVVLVWLVYHMHMCSAAECCLASQWLLL